MSKKFFIRVGHPWDTNAGPNGVEWGYSRTLDRAIERAISLSKNIRTDCQVFVTDGERVLARSGVNSGPGGEIPRLVQRV